MSEAISTEVWRAVPSFPGYEVSSLGQVRSCRALGCRARNQNVAKWRMLRQCEHGCRGRKEYRKVKLCKDGKPVMRVVHQLVLEAFVGPCPEGMEVCHVNDVKHDNRLENLRWGTRKDNRADADKNGITKRGSGHARAKLTEEAVREARRLSGTVSQRELGERFGVSQTVMGNAIRGVKWKHVD